MNDNTVGDGRDDGKEGEDNAIEGAGEVERTKLEAGINYGTGFIDHTTWNIASIHCSVFFI